MHITYDPEADALYIRFRNGRAAKTRKLTDGVLIDMTPRGQVFGIEILDAKFRLSRQALADVDVHLPVPA